MQDELMAFAEGLDARQKEEFAALLGQIAESLEDDDDVQGFGRTPGGGDGTLANIDLQNALQQSQQSLQQMSNISKILHDTELSIMRKFGG